MMDREELRAEFKRQFPGGDLCQYDGECRKGGQQLIEMYSPNTMKPMEPYWFCEEHAAVVMAELAAGGHSIEEGGELPSR